MTRLPSEPPSWVNRYTRLAFADRGRDRYGPGVDCYGLLRLVYAEQLGISLDDYGYRDTADQAAIAAAVEAATLDGSLWRRVEEPRLYDAALFRIEGNPRHVGVVVGRGRVLHAIRGAGVVVERTDTPLWRGRLLGYYRFNGPVLVSGRPTPFASAVLRTEVEAGGTVHQILEAASVALNPALRVFVDGAEVARDAWHLVRPKPGRRLVVACVPEGNDSGKTVLRLVATIAIVAAAAYTGGAIAGAYFAAGTGGFIATSAAITAGLTIAGTLAVNALIPPPKQRLSGNGPDSLEQSPTIAGARNDLRPYSPFPCVLGQHRLVPPLAAAPYTETLGDDVYLRMLFGPWYGPCAIDQLRIGETSVEDFEGVEVQVRNGYPPELPITLYPNTIIETGLAVALTQAASWQVRTSETDADELLVETVFAQGLVQFAADGSRTNYTVAFQVEYSPAGAGTWTAINAASPATARGLDFMFRTPETVLGGTGVHSGTVDWGSGMPSAKPGYLPSTNYAWMAEGYVYAPVAGEYSFAVDGSDACDLRVGSTDVAAWYGSHAPAGGPDYTAHNGTITLQQGWYPIRARVEVRGATGALALGWKKPGDGAFSTIPAANLARDGAGTAGLNYRWHDTSGYGSTVSTTASRTEAIRRSIAWPVPAGQYDVRVRRTTADTSDSLTLDDLTWSKLSTVRYDDPVRVDGMARIGVRIKASDQLNGVIDQLNCVVTSMVPDWDRVARSWVLRATSNPASLYRAVLQGYGGGEAVPDDQIDLDALAEWHQACDDDGLYFNAVIDFRTTRFEILSDIAAAGRASYARRDGLYTVVRDRQQSAIAQHFTPRNSWGFRGRKVLPKVPHALRVQFLNRDAGYQQDERIVLNDGYQLGGLDAWGASAPSLPEATEFDTLELFGTTSASEAFKHGRFYLANLLLRQEVYEVNADVEHLVCNRGDLVMLAHDVPLLGLASGRIAELITDGTGAIVGVRVDEPCPMADGSSYRLRIRNQAGTSIVAAVVAVNGYQTELTFTNPIAPGPAQPNAGDLFQFGETEIEARAVVVKSIEVNPDLSARLEFVDYRPDIFLADIGTIPPFTSGISRPPVFERGPADPVIDNIRSDDWVMVRDSDGSLRPRMLITLRRPSGTRPIPSHAQVRTRRKSGSDYVGPWVHHPTTSIDDLQVSVLDVEEGATYAIRLRVVTPLGLTSNWVEAEHTVVGKVNPPPDVQSFSGTRLADGTRRYSWVMGPFPPDVAGVHIRYGASGAAWEDMTALTTDPIEGASPYESALPAAGGLKRFGIKMVDTAGNESVNMAFFEKDFGAPPREGLVVSSDGRLEGWPGTRSACFVAGEYLEANDSTQWGTPPAATWAAWSRWNLNPSSPISYTHPVIDVGFIADLEPMVYEDSDGTAVVEVAYSDTSSSPTNWTDVTSLSGVSVRGRYFIFRITVTATGGEPVPVVRDLVMMLRAQMVEQVLDNVQTATLGEALRIGPGHIYAPISAGLFSSIRTVNVTFNGTGAGWTWEVLAKSLTPGPEIRLYNPAGAGADALVDITVRGIAATAEPPPALTAGGEWWFDDENNSDQALLVWE